MVAGGRRREIPCRSDPLVIIGSLGRLHHSDCQLGRVRLHVFAFASLCTISLGLLDGIGRHCSETNLKTRTALKQTARLQSAHDLSKCKAKVLCEAPNPDLASFEGVYKDLEANLELPLTADQLLPRVRTVPSRELALRSTLKLNIFHQGASLEGTKIAHGVCVYTGVDTKLSLNSNNPRHKRYALLEPNLPCVWAEPIAYILRWIAQVCDGARNEPSNVYHLHHAVLPGRYLSFDR